MFGDTATQTTQSSMAAMISIARIHGKHLFVSGRLFCRSGGWMIRHIIDYGSAINKVEIRTGIVHVCWFGS